MNHRVKLLHEHINVLNISAQLTKDESSTTIKKVLGLLEAEPITNNIVQARQLLIELIINQGVNLPGLSVHLTKLSIDQTARNEINQLQEDNSNATNVYIAC